MPQVTVHMDTINLQNAHQSVVTGRHVDTLQGLLKGTRKSPWDPGPIDGLGGANTKAAVLKFQEDNHLAKDAIVGEHTWEQLVQFGP